MSSEKCKLCLFKTEPRDEIALEEIELLQGIILTLFRDTLYLSKDDFLTVCPTCIEKLRSFHEFYEFVLSNQTVIPDETVIPKEENELEAEFIEPESPDRVDDEPKSDPKVEKQNSALISTVFEFNCDECERQPEFKTLKACLRHYKKFHDDRQKVWTCCGITMSTEAELLQHAMRKTHTQLKRICDLCDQQYASRSQLIRHMKELHIKNVECVLCGALFYDQSLCFKHHNAEHSEPEKVPCPKCGLMIKNQPKLLLAHIKRAHVDTNAAQGSQCPICGKIFSTNVKLCHHLYSHRPPRYQCHFCEKKFRHTTHRKDHEATHTEDFNYVCEFSNCGKKFKSTGNYTKHKRKAHPVEYQEAKRRNKEAKYRF